MNFLSKVQAVVEVMSDDWADAEDVFYLRFVRPCKSKNWQKIWNEQVIKQKVKAYKTSEAMKWKHWDEGRRPSSEYAKNPIIVGHFKGNYWVLDGSHRLLYADDLDEPTINAIVLELDEIFR